MDREQYLETWHTIKAAALDGLDVAGFALVAIDTNGQAYWGANFSLDKTVRRDIANYLNVLQTDLRRTNKTLEGE